MQQPVTPPIIRLAVPWKGIGALVLATFCWGFAPVLGKDALSSLPPLTVLIVQLATSSALLWIAVAILRIPLPPLNRHILRLTLMGILAPGLTATLLVFGLTYTTASNAALLITIEPLLIIFLAWLLLREHVTGLLVALAVLASIGVILVAGGHAPTSTNTSILGNLLLVAGSGCMGLYVVLMRQSTTTMASLLLVALQQTSGFAWAIILWTANLVPDYAATPTGTSLTGWGSAAASGMLEYALAFWFYLIGLRAVPASVAAFFLNLTPIFGISGAYLMLGERLQAVQWLGAALILIGVASVSKLHGTPE